METLNHLWLMWIQPGLALAWGLLSPLLALAIAWYGAPLLRRAIEATERRLGVQVDAQTNDAIQAAAMNGMGMVLGGIRSGRWTLADVRSGAATKDFIEYMRTSVPAALLHHAVPDARLALMLQGKLETALKDADVAPGQPLTVEALARTTNDQTAALAGRLDALRGEVGMARAGALGTAA